MSRAEWSPLDEQLLRRYLRPVDVEVARFALEYWLSRLERLPRRRRGDRREVREMVVRWEHRLLEAENHRRAESIAGRVLVAVGLGRLVVKRRPSVRVPRRARPRRRPATIPQRWKRSSRSSKSRSASS
jgi:hypothetical protein